MGLRDANVVDAAARPRGSGLRDAWLDAQEWALERLGVLAARRRRGRGLPEHLVTGVRGEAAALFHLRRQGYTIVARRWGTALVRGDVDLIGWDGAWLCFIEVKARTGRGIVPAEFAVDREKQETLRRLARIYLKRLPVANGWERTVPVRFDVVSVYFEPGGDRKRPDIEVFRGAFGRAAEWRRE